jgi:hypothetical protein
MTVPGQLKTGNKKKEGGIQVQQLGTAEKKQRNSKGEKSKDKMRNKNN